MNKPLASLFAKHKAIVLFDCETTGTDPAKNQIIELAAMRIEQTNNGSLRVAGQMDSFIRLPEGERIPEKIVELTGITDEILQAEGVATYKAAAQFAKLLNDGPVLMVAHNAQFDLLFTRELLRGHKCAKLSFLDPLTVYKDRRPYPHKLANAIISYNLTDKAICRIVRKRKTEVHTITRQALTKMMGDNSDEYISISDCKIAKDSVFKSNNKLL